MDLKIYNAFLPHDDRDAAVAFYCDTLGFELRNNVGYNDMHWLTVGPPDQPDVNLVLFPPGADPGITDDERRVITEMMAKGTTRCSRSPRRTWTPSSSGSRRPTPRSCRSPPSSTGRARLAFRDPSGNTIRIDEVK